MMIVSIEPTFGNQLRLVRTSSGLSQSQLAELTGYTRQFIWMLERGESQPSWEAVLRLAKAMNVSVSVFESEPTNYPVSDQPASTTELDPLEPRPRPRGKGK